MGRLGSPGGHTLDRLQVTMYTVNDLASRFDLHPKSVRDRINSLGPAVEAYLERGRNNAILLTDGGLAVFDRLIQLEREGHTTAAAVQRMQNDRQDERLSSVEPEGSSAPTAVYVDLISELRSRVEEQAKMIAFFQTQMAERDDQIRALTSSTRPELIRINRWQAFRIAFLGR